MDKQIINIVTQNVKGLRDNTKCKQVFQSLKQKKHDIVLLQETHTIEGDNKDWDREWGSKVYLSHGTNMSRGTAILINSAIIVEVNTCIIDPTGRYVILDLNIKGCVIGVASIYAPNEDDLIFFGKLFETMDKLDCQDRIIGGGTST